MKKRASLLAVVFAVTGLIGMALPAAAADLHGPHQNTPCSGSTCEWHFVNNQLGDAGKGNLWVYFDPAGSAAPLWVPAGAPDKTNKHVQHWWVETGPGTLLDARTVSSGDETGPGQPGKLVLSDLKYCCGCGCTPR